MERWQKDIAKAMTQQILNAVQMAPECVKYPNPFITAVLKLNRAAERDKCSPCDIPYYLPKDGCTIQFRFKTMESLGRAWNSLTKDEQDAIGKYTFETQSLKTLGTKLY